MFSLRDFISTIIRLLDESNVPYFVTGSFASTAYSGPRATQDIDLHAEALRRLVAMRDTN
jgi:hypothetical protein